METEIPLNMTYGLAPDQQTNVPNEAPEDEQEIELPLPKLEGNLVIKTDKVFISLSVGIVLVGLVTAILHATNKTKE